MVTVSSPELTQFASSMFPGRFGPKEARALAELYDEFGLQRRRALAPVAWTVDGKDVRSLFEALADPRVDGRTAQLRFGGPVAGGPAWEFLLPTRRLVLAEDGSAELVPGDGGMSRRAIVRFLLRERFSPETLAYPATGAKPPVPVDAFGTLADEFELCRSAPVLPLGLALLVYLPGERVRYEVDLVRNYLLGDPRAGRLAAVRRVGRTARFSWGLDRQIGRGRLSPLGARCLELLAETHGLTAVEIDQILGVPRELVEAALHTVVDRGFATLDRRTARYHAQIDAFLPQPAAPVPAADPALRTSVQELIAAAESKATCPLCGNPIPADGRDRILCDDCAKTVGLA